MTVNGKPAKRIRHCDIASNWFQNNFELAVVAVPPPNHSFPGHTTMFDNVSLSAQCARLSLSCTNIHAIIDKNVANVVRIICQSDREIVEVSLLVLPAYEPV